ncbi:MAG TPA: carboxypeptidase-like regulatory domain-containing protein [Planctomycetota bacterium]|nr:carboxypeptidase-like regulatory domain-containing protein [Planctomycetota bacterium]
MHMTVVAGALALVSSATMPAQAVPAKGDVRLVGRIVSVLHEGVPAAEVWVTDVNGNRLGRTVADGDGYYQLGKLPPVRLRVHARGGDKVQGSIAVAASGLVREATLMLEDGDPVRGTVELPDGTRAAGAAVVVTCETQFEPPFDWWAETTADANGAWSVPLAPMRPLIVRAFVAGRPIAEQVERSRRQNVQVLIPLGELATRSVKVTGGPAGNAMRVVCDLGTDRLRNGYRLPAATTETTVDASGAATVWDLKISYEVRVIAPGWQSMPVCVRCVPGTARELSFALTAVPVEQLAPSTRMTGKLVDELGAPIADVTIMSRYESDPERVAVATSAADGVFEIDVPVNEKVLCQFGLSSREWRLGHPRAALGNDGVTWFTVPANGLQPLRLDATRAGAVTATLLGPGKVPVMATRVELAPAGDKTAVITATDAAGRLDIAGLPPGSYLLSVGTGGRMCKISVDVPAGASAAVGALEWEPTGEVRGVVNDASGKPVASTMLFVMAPQRKQRKLAAMQFLQVTTGVVPVLTDRQGRYRIPYTPAGEWILVPRPDPARAGLAPNLVDVTVEERKVTTVDLTTDR